MNAALESVRADLGGHVEFISGFAFKSSKFNDQGEGLPIARIRDVVRGFSETFYEGEFDEKFVIKDRDYLIGMDGEFNLAKWKGGKALLNQRVCKLGDISENLDRHYLARFLPKALKDIEDVTSFVTVKHISVKQLRQIQIPLPPLEEQKRIAGILDAADILRAKRREALAKLDDLLQATFLDLFGDPVTNPKGWEVVMLKDAIKVKSGNGLVAKEMAIDGEYPVYGGNGINGYHDSFMFEEPKIVLGRVGVYCGCVHLTQPFSWVTDNALYVEKLHIPIDLTYLVYSLGAANLNQYAGQAAQPLISGNRIYPVEILLPPLDLQQRFAEIVSSVEEQKAKMRKHLEQLDDLFASLQQRAFRGDL